jgi:hypothetical protein
MPQHEAHCRVGNLKRACDLVLLWRRAAGDHAIIDSLNGADKKKQYTNRDAVE